MLKLQKAYNDKVVDIKNYSFEKYRTKWVEIMDNVCESRGSWENRKNYKSYRQITL